MKAFQIISPHHTALKETVAPACRADEVLLRIRYVGFCGSDLNTYLGRNPMVRMPVIPGHEVGATIEGIGIDVPGFLHPGQNVTVNPYTNCGRCAACRNGRANACEHNETFGVQRDGTMTEFVAVPWQKVVTAEGLPVRHCALVEPMSVGFHAVSRAQVTDVDTVLVIGCGMIGLGAVVRAALRGAKVIAADVDDEKLEVARSLGAACLLNTKTEDVHAKLVEYTEGFGPDVVIEAVGSAPTYVMAVREAAFTGRVVYIGYAKNDISFQTKLFVQKELDIRGSRNALPEDFRAVVRYLQKGRCPVDRLVSLEVSPEQAGEALQQWADNPAKVFRILVKF